VITLHSPSSGENRSKEFNGTRSHKVSGRDAADSQRNFTEIKASRAFSKSVALSLLDKLSYSTESLLRSAHTSKVPEP
jgi:hypothetical protein